MKNTFPQTQGYYNIVVEYKTRRSTLRYTLVAYFTPSLKNWYIQDLSGHTPKTRLVKGSVLKYELLKSVEAVA